MKMGNIRSLSGYAEPSKNAKSLIDVAATS
jgi:hypothetical protein